MTWGARFRLAGGLLLVVAIVAAFTVIFAQRQTRAESTSAAMTAQEFDVGTTYAGTVTESLVEVGDDVTAGEDLFSVRSPALARDLATEAVTAEDFAFPVASDGSYVIVSTVDGTVSEVSAPVGDFVQGGQVVARIDQAGTLAVTAEFTLTARDYGRIADGSVVDLRLPNDLTVSGVVDDIDVDTVAGRATSVITVTSASLAAEDFGGLYQPGTPVVATVHLRDDGPLAGVTDAVGDFLRKIGL
ncbi:HlyD family efflux transporter periplasmic adaptor subunit [uncultured Microbacterium sp.]|uniref:HlyD family efflux transporter periplasmic adaptor subunit n=1 Tax=uncultured Microbacterium sp. TaxID=191216 RepID=UPI002612B0A8|nr:HlyD family efflux transporter periplasmic adaptor subunit [uncultured Microbacterium sp.]